MTNADFLKLPEREQRVWVSGIIEGVGSTLILKNPEQGRCVLKWYASGSKFAVFQESAKLYPTSEPATIMMSLANRACKFHE